MMSDWDLLKKFDKKISKAESNLLKIDWNQRNKSTISLKEAGPQCVEKPLEGIKYKE